MWLSNLAQEQYIDFLISLEREENREKVAGGKGGSRESIEIN